jgi:hypothetical protein
MQGFWQSEYMKNIIGIQERGVKNRGGRREIPEVLEVAQRAVKPQKILFS